jgi:FKBP-type peptidyl-prolyl cis-trans isomerase 2
MGFAKLLVATAIFLLLAGCSGQQPSNKPPVENAKGEDFMAASFPVVKKGDIIKVEYVGKFTDGNVFDKSEGRGPLEFQVGSGQMIKGFDSAVVGMKLGEEKTVTIEPKDAYGNIDDAKVISIPLSQIQVDGNIYPGQTLYASNGFPVEVVDVKDGNAFLKIIHPLAGKTLVFWIKIVSIN